MKSSFKFLIFRLTLFLGATTLCLFLLTAYLYAAKYFHLRVPAVLRHLSFVKKILRDNNFQDFEAKIRHDRAPEETEGFFQSVWDHNQSIELSKEQFLKVMMYGKVKYMHRPNIQKFYLNIKTQGEEHRFDIQASPELLKALPPMGPLAVVSASFDENGFRKTDFNLQGPCDVYTLFAGDSFTEGLFVNDTETFVNQFGHLAKQKLNYQLCPINSGVNGYSTLEERFITEKYFGRFHYPVVFLMHFANDVYSSFSQVLDGTAPHLEALWKEHYAELKKFLILCHKKKITPVLVAIPFKEQFHKPDSIQHYQEKLRAFSQQEKVIFIDLYEILINEDYDKYFIPWDAHFSPEGHRRVAEILWEKTSSLFLEKGKPLQK